jgi:hypothetical protein
MAGNSTSLGEDQRQSVGGCNAAEIRAYLRGGMWYAVEHLHRF